MSNAKSLPPTCAGRAQVGNHSFPAAAGSRQGGDKIQKFNNLSFELDLKFVI